MSTRPAPERELIVMDDEERPALDQLERLLTADAGRGVARLSKTHGDPVDLPDSVLRVLQRVVRAMAHNQVVEVTTVEGRLTTQQAADLLNVPRAYLMRLLEAGTLPSTAAEFDRGVPLDALLAYRRQRDAERREGLRRLTRMSQEMGLYESA